MPPITITVADVEDITGEPFKWTKDQCHGVSLAIVKSGLIPAKLKPRVARGHAKHVLSQHSWVVLGDCYDDNAWVIDPTLWSVVPHLVNGVYHAKACKWPHRPHGYGNIWAQGGPPPQPTGERIELAVPVSDEAIIFLGIAGYPFDIKGWMFLANAPVGGWPAAEVIAAMDDTPALKALVPIDRLGMLTERNPQNLYLPW